jgi:predicted nucleic acid-binding protein
VCQEVMLLLAERVLTEECISVQVLAETQPALARKLRRALCNLRQALSVLKVQVMRNSSLQEVSVRPNLNPNAIDIPIVLAPILAK